MAKKHATTVTNYITLDVRKDPEGKIRVCFDDNNVMLSTVEEAARACRMNQHLADFNTQFQDLLEKLARWTAANSGLVGEAFLTTRSNGLLFVAIMNRKRYSRDLEDELTNLDMEIARSSNFNLIQLSVIALPKADNEAYSAFLNHENTMIYVSSKVG